VTVFRRRTEEAPTAAPEAARSEGKGRPTPKRSDAQKRKPGYITAPKDRKQAYKQTREQQAVSRVKAREGMARGDDRYLPKRDKGPVRKLARDYIDSRRSLGSYTMIAIVVMFLFTYQPVTQLKVIGLLSMPVILAVLLLEGFFFSRGIKKLAAERFPDENRAGVGLYTASRSMQFRKLRMPPPRLKPGQQDQV
jgi:hypothetical protein